MPSSCHRMAPVMPLSDGACEDGEGAYRRTSPPAIGEGNRADADANRRIDGL